MTFSALVASVRSLVCSFVRSFVCSLRSLAQKITTEKN